MESTESPLDVLSRAATMVQDNSPDVAAAEDAEAEAVDARPRAHKELPTARWRRERRGRERPGRERGAAGDAARAGARARPAPDHAAAPAPAPAPPPPMLSPPAAQESASAAGFPTRSSPPSPEVLVARTAPDTPLDMSTRARCSPPPYGSHIPPSRPSVITCAPAATAPSSANHSWNQQQESSSSSNSSISNSSSTGSNNRQGHRRELLSGMCDPVIDEHFRRSLGKDYLSVFSNEESDVNGTTDVNDNNANTGNSVTVTGLSVDDHFAKALGDTWVKLQEQSAAETTSHPSPISSLGRDKKATVLPQQQQQPPRGLVSI